MVSDRQKGNSRGAWLAAALSNAWSLPVGGVRGCLVPKDPPGCCTDKLDLGPVRCVALVLCCEVLVDGRDFVLSLSHLKGCLAIDDGLNGNKASRKTKTQTTRRRGNFGLS